MKRSPCPKGSPCDLSSDNYFRSKTTIRRGRRHPWRLFTTATDLCVARFAQPAPAINAVTLGLGEPTISGNAPARVSLQRSYTGFEWCRNNCRQPGILIVAEHAAVRGGSRAIRRHSSYDTSPALVLDPRSPDGASGSNRTLTEHARC
jgi:hypothetical protein